MNRTGKCLITLGCAAAASGHAHAAPAVRDEATLLVAESHAPARFAHHVPAFSAQQEDYVFTKAAGKETLRFWTIKDGSNTVAVLHEGLCQLDMITFDPTKAPTKPPFAPDGYSWGKLLGTRITTAAWYGDMSPSGDHRVITFSGGGASLTLTVTETWSKIRKGESAYIMVLRVDPILGYVWDCDTKLATNSGLNAKGERERIEFFNWQVKTTHMGWRHEQPWPDAWTHERTVFHRDDDKLVGFYMNPEANDRGTFKRTPVKDGGYVAMLPGPDGWGVALAHLAKGPYACNNATCNMWADQHNYLALPAQPDADGMFRVAAKWRFQAIPPEAVTLILKRVEMDDLGHTGTM